MNILLLEDNPDHAELIQDSLESHLPGPLNVTWCTQLEKGFAALASQDYDLLLCDLQLPDSPIEQSVARLQQLETHTPVVVLTSLDDEQIARLLIGSGIQDYFPKDQIHSSMLARVCNHSVERHKQQLKLEEKNRDQEQFCYSLCHDFKEPIRKATLVMDMLESDLRNKTTLSDENEWCLSTLYRSMKTLKAMTDGLYEYLRVADKSFITVNLEELLDEVIKEVKDQPNTQLERGPLPIIEGNPTQLTLLFKNLINNALKYNDSDVKRVSICAQVQQGQCEIQVSDNGIGMEEHYISQALRPFKRLVPSHEIEGIGLGLCIVNRVVENHNGRMEIESEVGKGTTLNISIPLSQDHTLNPLKSPSPTFSSLS